VHREEEADDDIEFSGEGLEEEERPDVTSAFDRPPRELAKQPLAQQEWRRVVPRLREANWLLQVDRTALIVYCATYANWKSAQADIEDNGATFVTKKSGYIAQRPSVSIAQNALASLMKFWTNFGMTPAARAKVRAALPKNPGTEGDDPMPPKDQTSDINTHDDDRFEQALSPLLVTGGAK